jgi:predicted ArsR family transcriptional regulator
MTGPSAVSMAGITMSASARTGTAPLPTERSTAASDRAAPPLSAADFAATVTAITSAFGDPTRREIFLFASRHDDGVTAAETAEHFTLHPNVARHHLDKLSAGGYLDVTTGKGRGSGAGRPSKRYTASELRVALDLPLRRDDVLITLLGRALSMLPREVAEQMAEEVGVEYGRVMARSMSDNGDVQRSFRSALHAVATALTAHGFAAHAESRDDDSAIVSEHCPFGDAAIEHPVMCAVDRGMVRGMLGALYGETETVVQLSRPRGDDVCVTSVLA